MAGCFASAAAVTAESRLAPSCDASSCTRDRRSRWGLMPRLVVTAAVGSPVDPPRTPTIGPGVVAPPIRSPINPPPPPVSPAVDPPPVLAPVGLHLLQIDFRFT